MNNEDFDLGDLGDLDQEPAFSGADDSFLPPESAPPPARPPRNTSFLVIVVILVIVFISGLVAITLIVIRQTQAYSEFQLTSAAIELTNNYVYTSSAATATAKSWTATPSPTPIPTDTPTNTPTETPSLTPTIPTETPTPTEDFAAETKAAGLPGDQQTQTRVALDAQNMTATCTIDPTSPGCGGSASLTPSSTTEVLTATTGPTETAIPDRFLTRTAIAALTQTALAAAGSPVASATLRPPTNTPIPHCRPGQTPTPQLPCTGLFEDLAGGNASPSGLAIIGLAAIGLVGVIFVSRRLRIKQQ